jgi:hypothetical protein
VEASKVLGEQMTLFSDPNQGIATAFRKLTGRNPLEKELQILMDLRDKEYQKFKTDPAKLKGWLTTGEYQISSNLDPSLVAANAVTASAILNSDAFLTKR